jgi:hypothetical protein
MLRGPSAAQCTPIALHSSAPHPRIALPARPLLADPPPDPAGRLRGYPRTPPGLQVQTAAMTMLEVLGQNCTACLELGVEPVSCDEAPAAVLHALQLYPQDALVQAAGVRALLSLSGCFNCRCFYDRRGPPAALLLPCCPAALLLPSCCCWTQAGRPCHPSPSPLGDTLTSSGLSLPRLRQLPPTPNPPNTTPPAGPRRTHWGRWGPSRRCCWRCSSSAWTRSTAGPPRTRCRRCTTSAS